MPSPSGVEAERAEEKLPVKLTPLYHKHMSLGARMAERNGWLVPAGYQAKEAEVRVATESVGLADESSSTKIDMKGSEIDAFASQVLGLTSRPQKPGQVLVRPVGSGWAGGSIRHFCRLANDHALLILDGEPNLSGSSPIGVQNPNPARLRVYLTNVTSVFACLTLAGPNSAGLLRALSNLKILSEDSPAPACSEGSVAGTQAMIVRSGTESGAGVPVFEVYCGRDYAEYLWDAMMDEGKEHGIVPIGPEALSSIRGLPSQASKEGRSRN